MPSYFEMLRLAELDRVFGADFIALMKASGLLGFGSLVFIFFAWVVLVFGWVTNLRRMVVVSCGVALAGGGVGWLASFTGYQSASRLVESAQQTPNQNELLVGANHLAWAAYVPSILAVITIAAAVFVLFLPVLHAPDS